MPYKPTKPRKPAVNNNAAGPVPSRGGRSLADREPAAPQTDRLQLVSGWHAALAVLNQRPADVQRLHHDPDLPPQRLQALAPHLRALAAARKPYRQTPADELQKLAGTHAHQGIVLACAPRQLPVLTPGAVDAAAAQPGLWLALDGVANPHNVGALARSAAFLGVRGLWLAGPGAVTACSPAALRTAEGALESLPLAHATDLRAAVQRFAAAGGHTAALSVHASQSLWQAQGLAHRNPVLLVCGAEEDGLHPEVERACQQRLHITGTQPAAVESLNVSAATAIALAVLLQPSGR